ncbi:MAG: Fe-S cluster protein [Verrucomicrobiales bacterium]|nr:Fe-S cluster protein [Verrucomicrobiales bacterium]|tara:strand:+ start:2274 stop:3140 length:867 start_codon:yes stop_codon:yes gene_type:complete
MSITEESTLRVLLYEGTGSTELESEDRFNTMSRLLESGYTVTRATGNGKVASHDRGSMLVLGQFADGQPPADQVEQPEASVRFQDISELDQDAIIETVEKTRDETGAAEHGAWKPWFPVIDYDRCTNCMQCLSFCLFNVYGVDDDNQIQAQHHDNCKTNCPACSRVCPEAAIMFPKYKTGPINGDKVTAEDMSGEKMKVDISALLGGDVYSALRNRSVQAQERFSKERDEKKALNERQKCMKKLAESATDIPKEVLMSLPSPDEIAKKADEAKARAEAALARQRELEG